MRKRAIVSISLALIFAMPCAFASTVVLNDLALNDNGAFTDGIDPGLPPASLVSTFDSSGLGTLTYTNNPGTPGSYFMAMYFDYDVSVPFWNEYGAMSGTPVGGQTWQIDSAVVANDANFPSPTLFSNVQGNALDNTNHVPGTTDNSFFNCGANGGGAINAGCNTDVAFGMGFAYALGSNQEAVITFTTSQSPCSGDGLCLADFHPVDAFNTSAQAVYLSATITIQPTTSTPEPASWLLIGSATLIGFGVFRRKLGGK